MLPSSSYSNINHAASFTFCGNELYHHTRRVPLLSQYHARPHQFQLPFANNDNDEQHLGVYVDLGSIDNDNDAISFDADDTIQSIDLQQSQTNYTTIEQFRSNQWIVLIDDEPSIRLAIGDYLFSNGYSVVTACDGPLAFLEMMLWSCSHSLLISSEQEEEDNKSCCDSPTWMDEKHQHWRLPSCIISDIRMPGGIDGVQLLQLLRRSSPVADADNAQKIDNDIDLPNKKRKKGRKSIGTNYDNKDDFELIDAIGSSSVVQNERRVADQAFQYITAIRRCIEYFINEDQTTPNEDAKTIQNEQYPSSLQQIPVILLTAKAMLSDRIVGYQAGANGYLPKPFRPEELLGMVDNLMRKQERERYGSQGCRAQQTYDVEGDDIESLSPNEAAEISKELAEIKILLESERERNNLESLLPEALWMYKTGQNRKRAFTKQHIRSILFYCFGIDIQNVKKSVMVEELENQIHEHPEKLIID